MALQWMLLAGLTAWVVSYSGVLGLRNWALRSRMLDIPNERSSHSQPTPRGGGLAIVVTVLLGLLLVWRLLPAWPPLALAGLFGTATLIAAISWMDDRASLPSRIRLGTHCLAALLLIASIGFWQRVELPLIGSLALGWLGLLISMFWIVGLTNAYNFMDGIDGIAGSQALVAALGWVLLGWLNDLPLIAALGMLLAASSLGFLGHNWSPARIFMGDVGSAFLGFIFAALPIIAAQQDARLALAGVLLLWPFVFDTLLTFLRRWRNGENVFAAHRSHLYQRLVITGASHRFVTTLYSGLALLGMLLGLGWALRINGAGVAILFGLPLLCLALWRFVLAQERRRASQELPRRLPSLVDPS